eukprot:6184692-Amphidinium_carterae.1
MNGQQHPPQKSKLAPRRKTIDSGKCYQELMDGVDQGCALHPSITQPILDAILATKYTDVERGE